MKRKITKGFYANSCYFRTSVMPPYRKALIQITEKCNLKCAHCFVSARKYGDTIPYVDIKNKILPQLIKSNVISVSLTGGEPMIHPEINKIIKLFIENNIKVTLCTNGTLISENQIKEYQSIGGVFFNISLDGFSSQSHGKFRGDKNSFYETKNTIEKIGEAGLLKGILVTPNNLASSNEYNEICEFAIECNAKFVLMNPLSSMGRGVNSKGKLEAQKAMMTKVKNATSNYKKDIDVVHIRFPYNDKPLSSCEAGNIIYIFTNGDVTVCPYLVFSTGNPNSQHKREEFIVGNILNDKNIYSKLKDYNYSFLSSGNNKSCNSCEDNKSCGKGCPAGVISNGGRVGDLDVELCPKENNKIIHIE
ncbi:radical SAM protein [Pseudoalteromonas sp. JC3]|uniref:radical SAM/SPASM domain-containing protein n=1 Tax=Pseudoalteromonas sp. JC3 TaxID=2810196 RepID=UPI0019D04DD1|nr:radical SAM protein [Pseudoalteromonas sp. JC3]MBR8842411.1 radical SAM protein [Pseudoalteromonas sp. JC3]WJE09470.1 radical SAM protein [Pseudoalteromonas sp. JC3]